MNELPKRKQIRLKDYDYSQNGYYFITICTESRQTILSDVRRGGVLLRPIGKIAENEMVELTKRYKIEINPYIIMPDHIHMIIKINRKTQRAEQSPRAEQSLRAEQSPAPTVCDMICAFKSLTTKIANKNDNCIGRKVWQRNYYEHIIRDENDYITKAEYILNNPLKWELERNK